MEIPTPNILAGDKTTIVESSFISHIYFIWSWIEMIMRVDRVTAK
jgi:hypothetical protein